MKRAGPRPWPEGLIQVATEDSVVVQHCKIPVYN
jgi:hypothetical protein